jgi:hypothetical protein
MRRHLKVARKMRPNITVKVKPSPHDSKCTACVGAIPKGETATYVRTRIRRYHMTCVPTNVYVTGSAPSALPTDPMEAALTALIGLENAIVVKAKKIGITDELEQKFTRYQKMKVLALRPGTPGEERAAFRMAILEIVKLVF